MIMAEKATLYLENNKGMILDFTRSPQACDVYDFDGNLISGGGGGGGIELLHITLHYVNDTPNTVNFPSINLYDSAYYIINKKAWTSATGSGITIAPGESYDMIIAYSSEEFITIENYNPSYHVYSELVNMVYNDEYDSYDVIDNTVNSSITVTEIVNP